MAARDMLTMLSLMGLPYPSALILPTSLSIHPAFLLTSAHPPTFWHYWHNHHPLIWAYHTCIMPCLPHPLLLCVSRPAALLPPPHPPHLV